MQSILVFVLAHMHWPPAANAQNDSELAPKLNRNVPGFALRYILPAWGLLGKVAECSWYGCKAVEHRELWWMILGGP